MADIRYKVADTVNSWFDTLKQKANETGQITKVNLLKFSSHVIPVMSNININDVRKVNYSDVYIGSMTALFDAVIEGENILSRFDGNPNSASLLIVITDGQENLSKCTKSHFLNTLNKMLKNDTYTIVFLVPDQEAVSWLTKNGVSKDNIQVWENTEQGVEQIRESVTIGLGGYYECRSMGGSSMIGFFAQ